MMTCNTIRPRLIELVYGELTGEQTAAINEHLAVCAACREQCDLLRGAHEALSCDDAPTVTVRGSVAAYLARQQEHRTPSRRRGLVAGLAACAAAALVLVSLGVHVEWSPQRVALVWGRSSDAIVEPMRPTIAAPSPPAADAYGQLRQLAGVDGLSSRLPAAAVDERSADQPSAPYYQLRRQLGEM